MRLGTLLLATISLLQLVGCTTASYRESAPQIDQLLKEKQYGEALDRLAGVDPNDPDFSEAIRRHEEVEQSAAQYEAGIERNADKLIRKGQWAEALDRYDEALERLPKSVVLKSGLAKLHNAQRERTQKLEEEKLLLRGDSLEKSLPLIREIARVNPRDRQAQSTYRQSRDEAEQVAASLEAFGTEALDSGDDKRARRLLDLAKTLNPTKSLEVKLDRLDQREQETRRKAQRSRQRAEAKSAKRSKRIQELQKRFDQQLKAKRYLEARESLAELEKLDADEALLKKERQRLEPEIQREKERLYSNGVVTYSRGQYENAAKLWRQVLKLDPDHEQARESLERAERVLEKLKELQEKHNGE